MVIHELEEDIVMVEMSPTRHYQLWNKWDLYEILLNSDKGIKFEVEDFPIEKEELLKISNQLKK